MSREKGWFIYALGSGWGHLNRAITLASVAAQDRPIHVLTNSPYAERVLPAVQQRNLTFHRLPLETSVKDARSFVIGLLRRTEYDALVVDTFPRGLLGELADVIPQQSDVCHVLVHRDLTPDYIDVKAIAPFVSKYYDSILIPGEFSTPFAELAQAKSTAPWLCRSAKDLPNAALLRAKLNLSNSAPLVVVCGAGQPNELSFFGEMTTRIAVEFPGVTVRCLAATCPPNCVPEWWLYHWPGMDILQLADVVIGGGGYNLVHECAALGKPLIAFAWPRRYDRQERRIKEHAMLAKDADEAIALLAPLLQSTKTQTTADYSNGVEEAIAHIQNECDRSAQARYTT